MPVGFDEVMPWKFGSGVEEIKCTQCDTVYRDGNEYSYRTITLLDMMNFAQSHDCPATGSSRVWVKYSDDDTSMEW